MGDFLYIFHSFLYSFVELLTLKGIIIKLTSINLNKNGTSITLQSIKNCLKNFQTEKIFGFSGEPKFNINTALFTINPIYWLQIII